MKNRKSKEVRPDLVTSVCRDWSLSFSKFHGSLNEERVVGTRPSEFYRNYGNSVQSRCDSREMRALPKRRRKETMQRDAKRRKGTQRDRNGSQRDYRLCGSASPGTKGDRGNWRVICRKLVPLSGTTVNTSPLDLDHRVTVKFSLSYDYNTAVNSSTTRKPHRVHPPSRCFEAAMRA